MLTAISEHLKLKSMEVTLLIPYSDSGAAAKLFEESTVLSQDYEAEGIKIKVRLQANDVGRWQKYFNKRED